MVCVNSGYYQKFQDYGKLKTKPLAKVTQHSNTYTNDKNRGKGEHDFNSDYHNYEDNNEYDFGAHLDYNDVTGLQEFDPFKYVKDGVAGVEEFGHFDGQEGESDNLDYFNSYFN